MREISPYTEADLLLGVFLDETSALAARTTYTANLRSGEWPDEWANQAYREVNLDNDVRVLTIATPEETPDNTRWAFVVSSYAEGFGQIVRRFNAIYFRRDDAEQAARAIEESDVDGVTYCEIDEMPVGILQERW